MHVKTKKIIATCLAMIMVVAICVTNQRFEVNAATSESLTITSGANLLETGFNIRVDGEDKNYESGLSFDTELASHSFSFLIQYGCAISDIKINNTSYNFSNNEGWATVSEVPDATSYSIELVPGVSDDVTIVWCYNREDIHFYGGEDALVEHGKIDILTISRDGSIVWNKSMTDDSVHIDNTGGWVSVHPHDKIEVQFIPDYGYQLIGAKINGEVDLAVQESACTYLFEMPETNVHFQGIFTKTNDVVTGTATDISSASLTNGNAVADEGTARMTIETGTPASDSVAEDVDSTKSRIAVNITVEQLFYKNSASASWATTKTELGAPAEVVLAVEQRATGYAVLRDHNGTVTEIPCDYDAASGTIAFASNQFSTYTLVPLTEENNEYERLNPVNGGTESCATSSNVSSATTGCAHIFGWKISVEPQINRKGVAVCVCTKCGFVNGTQLVSNDEVVYTSFSKTLAELIANSAEGDVIVLELGDWHSIPSWLMEQIRESNRTVIVKCRYKGLFYTITIPNGKCVITSVPWYGPLYLASFYETEISEYYK